VETFLPSHCTGLLAQDCLPPQPTAQPVHPTIHLIPVTLAQPGRPKTGYTYTTSGLLAIRTLPRTLRLLVLLFLLFIFQSSHEAYERPTDDPRPSDHQHGAPSRELRRRTLHASPPPCIFRATHRSRTTATRLQAPSLPWIPINQSPLSPSDSLIDRPSLLKVSRRCITRRRTRLLSPSLSLSLFWPCQ
jgi:hypothetical protein